LYIQYVIEQDHLFRDVALAKVLIYTDGIDPPADLPLEQVKSAALEKLNSHLKHLSKLRRQLSMQPQVALQDKLDRVKAEYEQTQAEYEQTQRELNAAQVVPGQLEALRTKLAEQRLAYQTAVAGNQAAHDRLLKEIEIQKKLLIENSEPLGDEIQIRANRSQEKLEFLVNDYEKAKQRIEELIQSNVVPESEREKLVKMEQQIADAKAELAIERARLRSLNVNRERNERLSAWNDKLAELQIQQATAERHLAFTEELLAVYNSLEVSRLVRAQDQAARRLSLLQKLLEDLERQLMLNDVNAANQEPVQLVPLP
jgi:chromosome segregation ATPase